ncbi:uncharacterized protein HaLaN_33034, partial [Haematococcus lacustris]
MSDARAAVAPCSDQGLSGEAAEAQEYLVKLPDRIRKLAERSQVRKKKGLTANFSWIFNREVVLH